MNDNAAPRERIVITIDSAAFSSSTIDYAVRVAARLKRPLHGIFIEDADLVSCAQLPFAREICMSTGQARNLDSGILESAFGDILRRFQEALARRAAQEAVQWSVSSVRGRRRDFPLAGLAEADYCIVEPGHVSRKTARPARAPLRMLVVDGSGEAFYHVLDVLLQPLSGREIHLTLLKPPGSDDPGVSGSLPAGTHVHYLPPAQLPPLLRETEDPFDYVVVSRQRWNAELAALLLQLHCPLILVG